MNNTKEDNIYAVEIRFNRSVSNNNILEFVELLNHSKGIREVEFKPAGI